MSSDLDQTAAVFVSEVAGLRDFDDYEEVIGLLVWRDSVLEAIGRGERLSPASEAEFRVAVATMERQLPRLRKRFPEAFAGEAASARSS